MDAPWKDAMEEVAVEVPEALSGGGVVEAMTIPQVVGHFGSGSRSSYGVLPQP